MQSIVELSAIFDYGWPHTGRECAQVDNVVVERQAARWTANHVAALGDFAAQAIPLVDPAIRRPLIDGIDLWDMWPLQLADGSTARLDGWTVWMVLSAPRLADPDLRHHIARIRLLLERDGEWRDCGHALPEGFNPGSREWAGSAQFDPETARVTLFYTVAGRRGEPQPTFAQRMFQTCGTLGMDGDMARIEDWSEPAEMFAADGKHYMVVNQAVGVPGFIKGFRDPAHFRDPASGEDYVVFTASLQGSTSDFNGCVGIARAGNRDHGAWFLLPPMVSANGLNNEQERPQLIWHGGLYYLFWSTQRKVFAPGGPNGPNGIYGMVSPHLFGPYEPINGTGLVAANPAEAPFQTYSWWITGELEVAGFVDLLDVGAQGPVDSAEWRRAHFGGVPAPRFRVELDGTVARVHTI